MLEEAERKKELHDNLLAWFIINQRDYLPWRNTDDPYAILVAEKLLQQTSARQLVVDAYNELMRLYPTPLALSQADVGEIKVILRSLGFMYRANELKQMAQELVDKYNGYVPKTLKELVGLTGLGQYCARAVLSFAYHQDIAVVDTNVARFLHRVFGISDPIPASPASNKRLIQLATSLLPLGNSRNFNLAVLDLCALICVKRTPKCFECPIRLYCIFGMTTEHSNPG